MVFLSIEMIFGMIYFRLIY